MFKFVVLFCAVFAIVHGNTTQVSRCTSSSCGPLPNNTYIVGCSTPPCALPQQQDAVIQIDFMTSGPVQSMTTLVIIYKGILAIPYSLGEKAVTCNFLNTSCPVQGGQQLQYILGLYIELSFPVGTEVTIEVSIVNDANNESLVCLRVPVVIVAPTSC